MIRYRIHGYWQQGLLNCDLDDREALVLSQLQQFFESGYASICPKSLPWDGNLSHRYFYLSYSKLLADLPIMKIRITRMRQIISSLISKGFLLRFHPSRKLYLSINYDRLQHILDPGKLPDPEAIADLEYIKMREREFKPFD